MALLRILITGAKGFVAPYLVAAVKTAHSGDSELVLTSASAGSLGGEDVSRLDVTDAEAVNFAIRHYRPTHVVHLAGIAAPALAAADPQQAWRVHVQGSLNLAQAILRYSPQTFLVHVSSGLIYGSSLIAGTPADESTVPAPIGSYAITKAVADVALGAAAQAGLACIRLRPFNHIGPGQSARFLVPSLALQVAKIEAGELRPVMRVGNLDVVRDFLDVRDVARAYLKAIEMSNKVAPGTALNIASGRGYRVSEILDQLVELAGLHVEIERDPERMRMDDLPWLVGDPGLARTVLEWSPVYDLATSLTDILNFCRAGIRQDALRRTAIRDV